MRNYLKILMGLSILSYLNVLLLNYQIRTDGLDSIHPFWIFTLIVPILFTLIGFSESFRQLKRYTFIDILLKVTIVVIVLRAVNLDQEGYLLYNILTIPLFMANILTEWFFYSDYVKYQTDKDEVDLSYYQMIEEAQKNPEHGHELQERFLHAISYSRTLLQLLFSGLFFIFSIVSILAILKYYDLLPGILLGIAAVLSLLIFTFQMKYTLGLHIKLYKSIPKKRLIINIVSVVIMLLIIGSTTVLISVFELSLEYYLLVPMSYVFAMPIVISNNKFAQYWLDKLEEILKQPIKK